MCTDGAKTTADSVAATTAAAHNRNSDKLALLCTWCQNELEKINAIGVTMSHALQ